MNKLLYKEQIPFFNNVYALYPYGSRIFGTSTKDSDWDYVLVLKKPVSFSLIDKQTNQGKRSYQPVTIEEFQEGLNNCESRILDCYFLPPEMVEIKPSKPWKFKLNKNALKAALIAKTDWGMERAAKKMNSDNLKIGRKSLFHAIRILMFGLQIQRYEKIVDYEQTVPIWKSIMNFPSTKWEDFETVYKPIYLTVRDWFVNDKSNDISAIFKMLPAKKELEMKKRIYQDSKR